MAAQSRRHSGMPGGLKSGLQEVILLFDAEGTRIEQDLGVAELEALVAHQQAMPERAASVVRAAYAAVGDGLLVRGVVCFQLRVDENGLVDSAFNLPLRYLVRHAGCGPDLAEMMPYRLACRSQCPVPWHSVNLWEPQGEGDQHPVKLVQKAVWRKRLALCAAPADELTEADLGLVVRPGQASPGAVTLVTGSQRTQDLSDAPSPARTGEVRHAPAPAQPPAPAAVAPAGRRAPSRVSRVPEISAMEAVATASLRAERARHERRLTAMFGEEGRLNVGLIAHQHREQMDELTEKYRAELDHQQRNYLDQIRSCRDEIQKLRAALRNEQNRNRRLQGLLRGEI